MDGEGAPQVGCEPHVQHLAPLRSRCPSGARPVPARGKPSLDALHADDMGMPAIDRPARRRSPHVAGNAEHRSDEPGASARLCRVDQRLGSPRVEVAAIGAEAAMLCMQVADEDVSGLPPRQVRGEAARGGRLDGAPTRGRLADPPEQPLGGASLSDAGEREVGILRKVLGEPVERLGSSLACPGLRVHRKARGAAGIAAEGEARSQSDAAIVTMSVFDFGNSAPQGNSDGGRWPGPLQYTVRGCSSMVELQPSKLITRVRFPPPASFLSLIARPFDKERGPIIGASHLPQVRI